MNYEINQRKQIIRESVARLKGCPFIPPTKFHNAIWVQSMDIATGDHTGAWKEMVLVNAALHPPRHMNPMQATSILWHPWVEFELPITLSVTPLDSLDVYFRINGHYFKGETHEMKSGILKNKSVRITFTKGPELLDVE